VASVCRSAYYHLRQVRPTLQSLPRDAALTLVQTFISSRLDYCNSVLYGVITDNCASGDWNPAHRPHYAGTPVTSLAAGATTRHFQVGDTGSQVLERPSTWLSGRRLPSCRPRSSWLTVSRQYDAGHPSYDDVIGRQSICRRRTACLEQPSSCHP